MDKPAVVIDNGTGYTKMGFAGGVAPSYIVPTAVATRSDLRAGQVPKGLDSLDYHVGFDAVQNSRTYNLNYPIRHGLIENWDNMESLWHRCIFEYLNCEPEEHNFLLENREYTAEVMFETFNVPGMYIAVQAVLALAAAWPSSKEQDFELTGTVIDSGDGVTHVIPVAEGYVIGSCIRHIPLAGRDITAFVQKAIRDRKEPVPPEDSLEIAKQIKEQHCFVGRDLVHEFNRFDANPEKHFRTFEALHSRTKAEYSVRLGYEQFLGPELFFNPEIYSADFTKPLPIVVDEAILSSPIDTRRGLYKNIVLSGGSTMFKNFSKRLQGDLKTIVDDRMNKNRERFGAAVVEESSRIKVKVNSHDRQRYAVWFGGSILAATARFQKQYLTKAQYDEEGPRIARHNPVFNM